MHQGCHENTFFLQNPASGPSPAQNLVVPHCTRKHTTRTCLSQPPPLQQVMLSPSCVCFAAAMQHPEDAASTQSKAGELQVDACPTSSELLPGARPSPPPACGAGGAGAGSIVSAPTAPNDNATKRVGSAGSFVGDATKCMVPVPADCVATHHSSLPGMLVPYFIAKSPRTGSLGLFAATAIAEGTKVYQFSRDSHLVLTAAGWRDTLIQAARMKGMLPEGQDTGTQEEQEAAVKALVEEDHVYATPEGEAVLELGDCRFLNHSRVPNLSERRGGLDEYAARDIYAGEELTLNYFDGPNGGLGSGTNFPAHWLGVLRHYGVEDAIVNPVWK